MISGSTERIRRGEKDVVSVLDGPEGPDSIGNTSHLDTSGVAIHPASELLQKPPLTAPKRPSLVTSDLTQEYQTGLRRRPPESVAIHPGGHPLEA